VILPAVPPCVQPPSLPRSSYGALSAVSGLADGGRRSRLVELEVAGRVVVDAEAVEFGLWAELFETA
jgi:hypothetical protein